LKWSSMWQYLAYAKAHQTEYVGQFNFFHRTFHGCVSSLLPI
jgi:hypothetical protein